ncbi:MAG: NYN domain-containing protein [Gemmatimonadota bacterium]
MATSGEIENMAVFCDFENVALGVQDAKYEKFDVKAVLDKLLVKGSIVVKKAYCDWARYKEFKAPMHEQAFELIEIPHVRQSGKNSADIRMVVDALDLCYTKSHVDTFVIVSGDSDFSPLVSKLRENNKTVIGVGVKASTSDLLIKNCDEFIFYDDLVRASEAKRKQAAKKHEKRKAEPKRAERRTAEEPAANDDAAHRRQAALDLVLETLEELIEARGSDARIYASMIKQALKRRRPEFNESYHGYKSFGALIDDAAARGVLVVAKDEKTGQQLVRMPAAEQ